MRAIEMLKEMASVKEPFGLFEPHLWRDKIGDSLWHCYITSVDCKLAEGTGETMEESIKNCYNQFRLI